LPSAGEQHQGTVVDTLVDQAGLHGICNRLFQPLPGDASRPADGIRSAPGPWAAAAKVKERGHECRGGGEPFTIVERQVPAS
jgi:hypothetical protein